MRGLAETTLRDFGGGWNVSDSDLNLTSKYQPISDNVVRGIDGSFSVRQGYELEADFGKGVATAPVTVSTAFATTNLSPAINITINAHGRSNGDHITIAGLTADINGIPFAEINGTHGIRVVDANTIKIYVARSATSTSSVSRSVTRNFDNHLLGGNITHSQYFNRRLILFTDMGEIGTYDTDGNLARIWGVNEAEALTTGLAPTRKCAHWSSSSFKSTVIACNGYDRDKPLQINKDFEVEFLVDKASGSNSAVPRADYVISLQGFVVFVRTEHGDPFVEFSAKGTDGTFTRDPSPSDSAEVDLSMITETVETTLLGAAQLREKLYVAFYDKGMVGTIGQYNDAGNHVPDFNDTIAENGTVSHRTMVSLGNDVFMCDYAGVPSVSISQASGIFTPVRLSELIGPAIQSHLSNLKEDTLRTKSFAVFNRNDRSYMLFLPIYDVVTKSLDVDPLLFNDDLRALNQVMVRMPSHRLFDASNITIAGATDIGDLSAANINGVRRVVSIIDKDLFVVQLGGHPSNGDIVSAGGSGITITPVNDETIVYVFEYNKEFKIRRWTRYRGWNFDTACSSQRGKLYLSKGLRVYRMGDNDQPVYADKYSDYDRHTWAAATDYTVGIRVLDNTNGLVYICLQAHTSIGTFATDRTNRPDLWEPYTGEEINWQMETPWSDMQQRGKNKVNRYINIDSEGYDKFYVAAFTNQIRTKPTTGELIPQRSLEFTAGGSGGWGLQNSADWGGSRRTREEKVWPFFVRGKLIRWRYSGSTKKRVRIISQTMYYKIGNIR